MQIGKVKGRKIYRPWPELIRIVGSVGSARQDLVHSYVQQAILARYDVINLTTSRNDTTPFAMLDSCVFTKRCDRVFTIDLGTCNISDLIGLFKGKRLLHAGWDLSKHSHAEKMRVFLQELIGHVENSLDQSTRTVVILDDVVRYHPNEVLLRKLIDSCSQKKVTLIFSDGSFANDTSALLRQSELIMVCSLQKGDLIPTYIKDLVRKATRSEDNVTDFIEGEAVIAYKHHLAKSILARGIFKQADHASDLEAAHAAPVNLGLA